MTTYKINELWDSMRDSFDDYREVFDEFRVLITEEYEREFALLKAERDLLLKRGRGDTSMTMDYPND